MKLATRHAALPLTFVRSQPAEAEPGVLAGVRRILVLTRGGMADAVRATPYLRALRQAYPDAAVDVACDWWAADLLRACPSVDRVLALPTGRGPGRRFRWLRALFRRAKLALLVARSRGRYDLVLVSPYGRRLNDLLARVASRRYRIGFGGDGGDGWTRNLGYPDYTLPLERHYNELFGAAGVGNVELRAELCWSAEDDRVVDEFLRASGCTQPLVALHPGSDWSCQQWSPERWSRLTSVLRERFGVTPVITGSAGDLETAQEVANGGRHPALLAAGRFTPLQTTALVARCDFAVSVDSVLPALALAAGTPVAVIEAWPGPDWEAWASPGRLALVRPAIAPDRLNERCRAAMGRIRSSCHTPHCAGTGGLRLVEIDGALAAIDGLLAEANQREAVRG